MLVLVTWIGLLLRSICIRIRSNELLSIMWLHYGVLLQVRRKLKQNEKLKKTIIIFKLIFYLNKNIFRGMLKRFFVLKR